MPWTRRAILTRRQSPCSAAALQRSLQAQLDRGRPSLASGPENSLHSASSKAPRYKGYLCRNGGALYRRLLRRFDRPTGGFLFKRMCHKQDDGTRSRLRYFAGRHHPIHAPFVLNILVVFFLTQHARHCVALDTLGAVPVSLLAQRRTLNLGLWHQHPPMSERKR